MIKMTATFTERDRLVRTVNTDVLFRYLERCSDVTNLEYQDLYRDRRTVLTFDVPNKLASRRYAIVCKGLGATIQENTECSTTTES